MDLYLRKTKQELQLDQHQENQLLRLISAAHLHLKEKGHTEDRNVHLLNI